MNSEDMSPCPPGCQIAHGEKHMHHPQQHVHHQLHLEEPTFNLSDLHMNESSSPLSPAAPEPTKPSRNKRTKEAKSVISSKQTSKPSKKMKREAEDLNKTMLDKSQEWNGTQEMGCGSDVFNRQLSVSKPDWKDQDLGFNQVPFDESTMPVPVSSCTGVSRACYKWGNGCWQSSCCTTNLSMSPLPTFPNKRHARNEWKCVHQAA